VNANPETVSWIRQNVKVPVFHADYRPLKTQFSGKKVAAFSGVASPDHFLHLLKNHGAQLVFHRNFRDHHVYSSGELKELLNEAKKAGADLLATTGKDLVKIDPFPFEFPLVAVEVELEMHEGNDFVDFILQQMHQRREAEFSNR
jgi:tetraacyldisaccharide 4'-kinase